MRKDLSGKSCSGDLGKARDVVQNIVSLYISKVEEIEALREIVVKMMSEFKKEQELLSFQLRETLARTSSFRRKDFNLRIRDVLTKYEEKREKVKQLLDDFYKEELNRISDLTAEIATPLVQPHELLNTDKFKYLIATLQNSTKGGEKEIEEMLASLYRVRKELSDRLKFLLAKQEKLKAKDFKLAIKDIQARQKNEEVNERLIWEREKIKNEVKEMLNEVRAEQKRIRAEWQKLASVLSIRNGA